MTKKEIIKFLEKYNDDDELCIVLDEDKENNFVYTSKEKDMLGVYKEVIRFLSEQNITFDIMALCEMISNVIFCSDRKRITSLYTPSMSFSLDEDKENNFVYTSKEKDMLGVYKEVIRFLSEQNITFDIMALCEMICSDNIDTLYSLGYVNVNHIVKDNKLHFRISKKDLEENDKLEDVLFQYQDGMGIYQRTQWEDSYYGYLLLPLDTGIRMDRFLCVYFTC